ncbi:MAG: CDP-alcohol phosphatidyltransferase family protein [Planctomycetota bacterium]|nr:CDP-alcohol phosphatidyltransferase family protein [Planctomycetota bacterium]MDA0933809.1 CDP-alcohol phosphatidyltransferase family protein [Planctomycetota bacterium]
MDAPRRNRRLRDLRSVPVLPSLITLGNVFLGFLAMSKVADVLAVGDVTDPVVVAAFEIAAQFVFLAMVFDALDGRVARMTGQTSAFGAQLDSLADVVTFGCAPAFVAKVLINLHEGAPTELLPSHPKIYYFCAAVYVLCAAMRLARFNVESAGPSEEDHREFKGLPSPAAAAVVCSLIAFFASKGDESAVLTQAFLPDDVHRWTVVAMPGVLVLLGLLMVSKVPFPHMFYTLVERRHSFPFLATLVVLIGLVLIEWQLAFVGATLAYVAYGLGLGVYRILSNGRLGPPDQGEPEPIDAVERFVEPVSPSRN